MLVKYFRKKLVRLGKNKVTLVNILEKRKRLGKRSRRVRLRIVGLSSRPRLSVFRSNAHIYAQIIDDVARSNACLGFNL